MTFKGFGLIVFLMTSLVACDGEHIGASKQTRPVPDLPNIQTNLAFTCAYEKDAIPPRDPEADQLYVHARWLRKNNLLKEDPLLYPKIERLIRISTAYGHDKANLELRDMIIRGDAYSDNPRKEVIDLTEDLIKRGIPGGFYDMAYYLETGYGVKQDEDLARKYQRKAADLGNPEAQYAIGDKLTGFDDPDLRKIGETMWRCAAEQGHGVAARELGIWLSNGRYTEALQAFQLGVKAGDSSSASFLYHGFNGPKEDDRVDYLGQQKDEARVRRYKAIWSQLADYDYLHPKVPEIDQIVPLPPAKLPPWNGKLKWVEERKLNIEPPLPSKERIAEMANAKGLNPMTGRPFLSLQKSGGAEAEPESPKLKTTAIPSFLGLQLPTGATCPHPGTWACSPEQGASRRVFVAGEILAGVRIPAQPSLWQKLKGETPSQVVATTWTLVELPENNKA
jgi:uncharacterized protein